MLAISTAWNHHPRVNIPGMLKAVKEIGFNSIELGYKLTNEQLDELIPLLDKLHISVSSIHNYCPVPFDGPSPRHVSNFYRLSALDEDERMKAVTWTQKTINTASMVQAKVVIIHAGTIEWENNCSETLLKLCKQGKQDLEEFHQLRNHLLSARRKSQDPFMANLKKSLQDVMAYAQEKNILIGLETRYYPDEIPNCEEIGELLDLFHNQGMYYWHDVGHAVANERLGIIPHLDYLKHYQDKIIGFHLHGIEGLQDHLAPFEGDFDLTQVFPFIKNEHLKVIESHAYATDQQLKEAIKRLETIT